jgi:endoglucanase Acf2/uncharacterized protein YjdB
MRKHLMPFLILGIVTLWFSTGKAQIVGVGSGSYTTAFPGTDAAGRNTYPSGTPQLSGTAATKPVPTNDWWSNMVKVDHGGQAFNYPLSFRSKSEGLVVNYTIPGGASTTEYREPMSAVDAITVGVSGMAATRSTVSNHTDWTVTMNWNAGGRDFNATVGLGMPFVYFTKGSADIARIAVGFNVSGATVSGNKVIIQNNFNSANYVVFGPAGSTWTNNSGVFTSTLNGKNYWSMVMLPQGVDVNTAMATLEPYAYTFPGNTAVAWTYNAATGAVRSTFTVTPDTKEGTNNVVPMGLLPHHWSRLASTSAQPNSYTYHTVRGQMKILLANSFTTENTFSGILPTLPNLAKYSGGFDPGALYKKIDQMKGDQLPEWTDSYNEGQNMNRLIQAAHIAHQIGYTTARDQLLNTVKARLENWFSAAGGEVAFLFYYNNDWKTMIGYPAGHSQDSNLNDHHFHWGYFIHAAAAIEQYQPGWASQWGGMVDLLIRDASNPSRADTMFPFMRNFNPYSGHAWANGFATEPFGNDQESTSESMQFNCSLIHWGTITNNTQIRDLGIFLYTTEQSAVEEYWFDVNDRTFQPAYAHEMVARIWAAGYDNGTWWTSDIAASYGIQLYPIHGGALYMGHNTAYVQRVWNGMTSKTGVLSNTANPDLWYDIYWSYLAFLDPQQAINLYNAYPSRSQKVGVSDAQTYHWLHTMNAMGQVAEEVTANYPIAAVFNKAGVKTYVAYNYGSTAITVNFSDGFSMTVPARSMATNRDIAVTATLTSSATEVNTNGTVVLNVTTTGTGITKVEFYRDGALIGTDTGAPYSVTTAPLSAGFPAFHARAYVGTNHNVSNVVSVQVGSQLPYGGTVRQIPGTIEAGHYDVFEGGKGQGVAYSDATPWNESNFRTDEAVDAGTTTSEGVTVGWIDAGEWLEYTVNVQQSGTYDVTLRYTSGNTAGGGPFWFERADGTKISPDITVTFNDTNWSTYVNKVVNNVTLSAGQQVIRVRIGSGGFNLGRMTFAFVGNGDTTAPTVPTNLASPSKTSTSVNLTWTASTDNSGTVAGYEVFVNNEATPRVTSTTPSATVTGLSMNTTYGFKVRAKDAVPNYSAFSTSINVTTNGDTQAPTVPANLASPSKTSSSVDLTWTASTDNVAVTGYDVFVDNEAAPRITVTTTSATVSGLAAGTTYGFKVRAKDAVPNYSAFTSTLSIPTNTTGLPSPWTTADIGAVGVAGSASHSGSTFTANGSGADIWGTVDEFRFIHQPITGDVTITARVATLGNTDPWAKAGVMIREGTAANARHTFTAVTAGNGTAYQRRLTTGGESSHTAGPAGTAPYWVRLTRVGNVFTSLVSTNGTTWTQVGTETIALTSATQVGLAVTSHNDAVLNTATFDNVSVTTSNVPVTGVTVSPASASVGVNGTMQLTATVSPSNATNKNVGWSSSNTAVATVNATGLVTGVTGGSATITVTTQDGGRTASSSITVTTIVPVTGVTLSRSSATIGIGATQQLTATVAPSNATNKTVSWSSSNNTVATVSNTGLVTGAAAGTATITVTTQDGNRTASATITVINGPTFYQDCNYGGNAAALAAGTYTTAQLGTAGVSNNWVSSLRVPSGWSVQLYDGDNLTGTTLTVSADNSCLVGNSFNDLTSSVRVSQTSGPCTGTAASGDYSYQVSTSGTTVSWTFVPLAPIAGSTLSIIYIKVGSGAYAGYTMTASGSNFVFSQAHAAGTSLTFYFTYRVGTTTTERNSSANPHAYTSGATCSSGASEPDGHVSVMSEASVEAFDVYPNPAGNRLHLRAQLQTGDVIKVFDVAGREIRVVIDDDNSIDISTMPSGLYMISLTNRQRKVQKRFAKE